MSESNLALCVKREHLGTPEERTELAKTISKAFELEDEIADGYHESKEGVLIHIESMYWSPPIIMNQAALVAQLKELPESDYLLLESFASNPLSDNHCLGAWTENPWNLRKVVKVEILYDGS